MRWAAQRWMEELESSSLVHALAAGAPAETGGCPSLETVLGLPVPPKIHLALEALGTELTAEGLEAGVLATVGDEVGALAEGFATYLAFVGLLPCRAEKMVRNS